MNIFHMLGNPVMPKNYSINNSHHKRLIMSFVSAILNDETRLIKRWTDLKDAQF